MDEDNGDLDAAAHALNSAAIHLLRGLRSVDRLSGLTAARLSALSVIVFGGPQPLGRLARIEGVASPTMTRIVDGLESLGLARRESHPDNARTVMVIASDQGDALMREAAARRSAAIVAALRELAGDQRRLVARAAPVLLELPRHLPRG